MASRYHSISDELKKRYGRKIYKLSLQSGCTCPNRDGLLSYGGCTFCSEGGSGDFAAPADWPIEEQIAYAKRRVTDKLRGRLSEKNDSNPICNTNATDNSRLNIEPEYIAYFQSYSNTYYQNNADGLARLKRLYIEAIKHPDIAILSIGTRPDCIDDNVLEMLSELNNIKPVWVELGLQTMHDETAKLINRGYDLSVYEDAYVRLKNIGVTVITHLILGLPGESRDMMLDSVRYVSDMMVSSDHPVSDIPVMHDGVKLQLLHILKGTALAKEYEQTPFHILSPDEYCRLIVDCIRILPETAVIHRITGDGPKRILIEPKWSGDKKRVLNALNAAMLTAGLII